jgi:tripartite-type tricarboxylate transporter receptor subunit TctC
MNVNGWGVVAVSVAMFSGAVSAQEANFPVKPIRFLVGQAPGGATDIVGRMAATKMSEVIGQNVLVENRTGAAGSIAASTVAKGAPDGYSVLVVSSSFAINPSLYANLPFDPQKDLAPISLLAEAPFLLVVHPSLPVKSVKELVALGRTRGDVLTYGSGGVGSSGHLAGALFETTAGVKFTHVPYKGAGQALVDLLGGQITFTFASMLSSGPHVKQQRLRVLGVTSRKRSSAMPQVPTIGEAGYPGYSTGSWYGLLGPAATPPAILARISQAAHKSVMSPEVRERMSGDGAEPIGSSPAEFQSYLGAEIAKWRKVVASIGLNAK